MPEMQESLLGQAEKEKAHEYYLKNRDKKIAYAKKWVEENQERCRVNQKRNARQYRKRNYVKQYRAGWMRKWRKTHPEEARAVDQRRPPRSQGAIERKNTRQRGKYNPMQEKQDRMQLKLEIMNAYGGPICKCCDETMVEFLSMDHIDGNGSQHRREIKVSSGDGLYKWLKKNNFPSGFQVLCYNCNLAKAHNNNICPHQTIVEDQSNILKA